MTKTDLIERFVEELGFGSLIDLADILNIEHNKEIWLDDDYPDKEDMLRVKVADALGKVTNEH